MYPKRYRARGREGEREAERERYRGEDRERERERQITEREMGSYYIPYLAYPSASNAQYATISLFESKVQLLVYRLA